MKFELALQFADFHPDQVDKIGPVDLQQALKVIHSYPWNREFEKIEVRTRDNLTSTVPNVSITNRYKEILIVSARDNDHFIIEFLTPTRRGELLLPNNSFNSKPGLTLEDVVTKFFVGTLKDTLRLGPLNSQSVDNINVFKLSEYPLFISGLTVGVLTLILILNFSSNGFSSKALPAVYFVGFVVISIAFSALVTVQYLWTDWGKEVSFGQNGELTIKQNGKEVRIEKCDIKEIVVVENHDHRTLRYYKYARIKTQDGKTFIVTSFIIEPMDLINKLKVNHKEESVFLPTIDFDIPSEKQKQRIALVREKNKAEFLEKFRNDEDAKLRQIASDQNGYADYAVDAAMEILEKRKTNATTDKPSTPAARWIK